MLRENQKFREMRDSYVIFITKTDVLRGGLPMYHVDRNIKELDRSFNDGSHIIYVNGAYKDKESEIGKMIHDFRCKKSSDMYSEVLKEQVSYFKDTEGGRKRMCKIIEEYGDIRAKESAEKNLLENIKTVMKKLNGSVDTAMDFLDVPKENWDKHRSMIR